MRRTLSALLLAATALLGTAACGDRPDTTGDSNTENNQTQAPAPAPAPS